MDLGLFVSTNIYMHWRWDQGRLDYFQFDAIKSIAQILAKFDGIALGTTSDPLRIPLETGVGLPFAPSDYKVWRNYKRVFGCCLLATDIERKLICTEICHKFAEDEPFDPDTYFVHFIRHFYYPSPIFEGYETAGLRVYPVCAILKFLLCKARMGREPTVSIKEILELIIPNDCTGEEEVDFYSTLQPKIHQTAEDEVRQIRELLRFISQCSFLKWQNLTLVLDVQEFTADVLEVIENSSQPIKFKRKSTSAEETLALGRVGNLKSIPVVQFAPRETDYSFSEGHPKRVTHLRYERSPRLREMYFQQSKPPFLCDMCRLNLYKRYPWAENLLEVHHLLPLCSPIRVETRSTSLSELVGICPSCHKATHTFYKRWLDNNNQGDFRSYEEAKMVYGMAKQTVFLSV
jgi:hypothetical protein